MKPLLKTFILLLALCVSVFAETIKVGVLPYTNILKILKIYEPFSTYLTTNLNKKVEIYSSNSYQNFFNDSKNGLFDIVITGPHFGYIHIEDGFKPLFTYNTEIKSIFVVKKDSAINSIDDLKNKTISTSTYLSVSTMGGINALTNHGFENKKDFKLINSKSHTSAIMDVALNQSSAAITTYTPLKQLNDDKIKEKIRIIESDISMPHLFILIHPKIERNKFVQIKQALLDFENSKEGKTFFKKTGYKGYRIVTNNDLDKLKSIIPQTKEFLKRD